jgi:hypothetical protein
MYLKPLKNDLREEIGIDNESTPLVIERGSGFMRLNFLQRYALIFQGSDVVTNGYQHIAKRDQIFFSPYRPMPGHDYCPLGASTDSRIHPFNCSIDASSDVVIDEWVHPVPESVAQDKNIVFRKVDP